MKKTKIKAVRGKRGPNNTHFLMKVGLASFGTIYVPNELADKYPDLEEFEFEIPMEVND